MKMCDVRISVITVSFNSEATIHHTIRTVNEQKYPNLEHVFIDGGSNDKTVQIIKSQSRVQNFLISEPDQGIYDAMNKGVIYSTGQVICFLNSDDMFYDDSVLADVAASFERTRSDLIYGNIKLIQPSGKVARDWIVGRQSFCPAILQPQIPHPGMFISVDALKKIDGPFDSSLKIAADLKLQLQLTRFGKSEPVYLNRYVAIMRIGGASTGSLKGQWIGFLESIQVWNAIHKRFGLFFALQKITRKLIQIRF